ncbi:sugar phosphate isomerase/epimerase [Novosphingobium sp. BW1]|uniref:sugar phosphate isomerase/epimerase family protein n=1 Tax=Novosphingobium sp. BW1 TaxID=2592621 RepID=UPI001396959A|nr:sugar phosphate isomerase/epimerase [Novosphingobium sp. BW1]
MSAFDRRSLLRTTLAAGVAAAAPVGALTTWARSTNVFTAHRLPIGVQVYAVDEFAKKDLIGTFASLSAIGFGALELAGFHGATPQQLRAAADSAGLAITGVHLNDKQLGTTDEDARKIAADLAVLGARNVVMQMFIFPRDIARREGEVFPTYLHRALREKGAEQWKQTAALLNARGAALQREGLRLAYHNHNAEFEPVDDTTGWEILVRETDPALVDFEIDAGWVAAAGLDPVALVSSLRGRVRQMHVKDIKAQVSPNFAFVQDPAEIGAGIIDWKALLPAAYRAGVRNFYVEQEPPFITDRFESLAKSVAFLRA